MKGSLHLGKVPRRANKTEELVEARVRITEILLMVDSALQLLAKKSVLRVVTPSHLLTFLPQNKVYIN